MLPQTSRYLDLARQGRNEWWRYALGVLTIALFWLALGYIPYLLLLGSGLDADPMLDFVVVNFSIFMMLAGLAVAVRLIHRRSLWSLVAPDARMDWRRLARGAAAWGSRPQPSWGSSTPCFPAAIT